MENAVIYARYSSAGQNEQSIEGQLRICKEYAESKGFNVIKVYIDKAKSAWTESEKRVDFQKMLDEANGNAFKHIIVYKFDRFSRSRVDSMMYKAQLKKKHGIRVLSATEPVSDDEGGEIYEMFLEWNDEKYSQRLSKRVKDGLDISVENGTYCGGYLIYGYKIDLEPVTGKTGRFVKRVSIEEEQAAIIKYMFEKYDKGDTKKNIAIALNEQGYRFNGKPFQAKHFDKWINNPKYTGEFHFGGRLCNNMYPPIIDKALFERVQDRLKKNKYFAGGMATAREPYLLTGKLFCGHCGAAMVSDGGTSKTGKKYQYYACKQKKKGKCIKKHQHKEHLEKYVVECVVEFLRQPENAEMVANDTVKYYQSRTGTDSLKSIETKIANAKKEVAELADAFVKAKSSLLQETIEQKMNDYEFFLDDLLTQKSKLELERAYRLRKEDITEFIGDVVNGDPNDKEYQRSVIENLISLVICADDDTIVTFNFRGCNMPDGEAVTKAEIQGAASLAKLVQKQLPLSRQIYMGFKNLKSYRCILPLIFTLKNREL
ncbi:MAG: recombinase family protein [Clostridia bacterium]